ncbi:MAG TPA: hypothetical protein PJ995_21645 [Cyclobacteriaceae bacterium]|nr:hypothetical protein [Cyclobacteriaceae bacterium]HMY35626.1 hypothetical protein [bacterium]HMY95674.1 hypothetical protein [Cyclobacteriaceae bacterium]HNA14601.1 hypothetical protein [Cyclobacteriaceae bacterium]HNH32136.1 hypothetical protein [bacterium]
MFRSRSSFNKEGLIVSVAFVSGGREYFSLDTIYNLPYQRGLAAVRVYEEMKMKCDYDFLKAHCEAVNNIFTESKKLGFEEMTKIKRLNDYLIERLNIAVDPDMMYKLAAVVFFDKTESPFIYDSEYAKKKIAHWKKHDDVNDFFLQQPLQKLIPFLRSPEINLQTYSEVMEKLNRIHWEEVLHLLSLKQKQQYSDMPGSFAGAMPLRSEVLTD